MIKNEQGLRIAKLVHVSVENGKTGNSNKYYNMYEQSDGTVRCEWGRVGLAPKITIISSSEFDSTYREKTGPRKGYTDQTELFVETTPIDNTTKTSTGEVVEIKDNMVKRLFDDLMAYANKSIKQNYKVTQEAVTEAQVNAAQALVNEITSALKTGANISELNNKLLRLYAIIPRTMKDVRNHLFSPVIDKRSLEMAREQMAREQATLDTMAGQVELIKQQKESNKLNEGANATKIDLLTQMGLKVSLVTDKNVLNEIKTLMGPNANQMKNVFAVVNNKTQSKFDANLKNAKNKKTALYWHGSRNENIFNITQTGLLIRPSCAIHCGSAFGDGIYFASKCQKSIGYTSLNGSYWARGGDNKAYMFLFNVHLGNQYIVHNSDSSLCYSKIQKFGEFDSTYAKPGNGGFLQNEEFIIYKPEQCSIKYLIEIN